MPQARGRTLDQFDDRRHNLAFELARPANLRERVEEERSGLADKVEQDQFDPFLLLLDSEVRAHEADLAPQGDDQFVLLTLVRRCERGADSGEGERHGLPIGMGEGAQDFLVRGVVLDQPVGVGGPHLSPRLLSLGRFRQLISHHTAPAKPYQNYAFPK